LVLQTTKDAGCLNPQLKEKTKWLNDILKDKLRFCKIWNGFLGNRGL